TGFGPRKEALDALEHAQIVPTPEPCPPLPHLPAGTQVHLVSDGVSACELPPGASVRSVCETADTAAVIRLVARPRPADPLRVEAFVQVFNASPEAKSVRLTL